MKGILSGERGKTGAPRVRVAFSGLGRLEAVTQEGVGYKPENQDAIAWVKTPNGDIFLIDIDGMGGYAHGKEAANFAATTMVELLTAGQCFAEAADTINEQIQQLYPDAGAAVVAVQITPSIEASQPHRAQVHWAGDARLLILRENADGAWSWVYRSSDDSWAKSVVDSGINQGLNEARYRTQVISLHPMGHIITNGLGKDGYHLNTTPDGELPGRESSAGGCTSAEGLEAVELYEGDLVVLFSDGEGDNYLRTQHLLNLLETAENETDAVNRIYEESMYKMKVLKTARDSRACAADERFSFTYEGQSPHLRGRTLWADGHGTVWDDPEQGEVVAKFKADNISVMALHVGNGEGELSNEPSERPLFAWVRSAVTWVRSCIRRESD
jgi:serine/threonine protein phosphatase PrpC